MIGPFCHILLIVSSWEEKLLFLAMRCCANPAANGGSSGTDINGLTIAYFLAELP